MLLTLEPTLFGGFLGDAKAGYRKIDRTSGRFYGTSGRFQRKLAYGPQFCGARSRIGGNFFVSGHKRFLEFEPELRTHGRCGRKTTFGGRGGFGTGFVDHVGSDLPRTSSDQFTKIALGNSVFQGVEGYDD
jgi:hypothetical protein